jgi:hypothetical protein
VGLLFKPDRPLARSLANMPAPPPMLSPVVPVPVPSSQDRVHVLRRAILATIADEPTDLAAIFCDDVIGSAPAVAVSSRRELELACEAGDDALHDIRLTIDEMDVIGDKVIAEWRITAIFGRPFLLGDDRLIEPTKQFVRLAGITVAEFHGNRVRSFRHYLDEASLFEQMLSLG